MSDAWVTALLASFAGLVLLGAVCRSAYAKLRRDYAEDDAADANEEDSAVTHHRDHTARLLQNAAT